MNKVVKKLVLAIPTVSCRPENELLKLLEFIFCNLDAVDYLNCCVCPRCQLAIGPFSHLLYWGNSQCKGLEITALKQ